MAIPKPTPKLQNNNRLQKRQPRNTKTSNLQWNLFCDNLNLFGKEYESQDGSKFKAVNAKDQNFTPSKLDDRIKKIDDNIKQHITELAKNDEEEPNECKFTKEEINKKIVALTQRKEKYEKYQKELE